MTTNNSTIIRKTAPLVVATLGLLLGACASTKTPPPPGLATIDAKPKPEFRKGIRGIALVSINKEKVKGTRKVIKPDQYKTIYKSATFPTTGYGHAHNLHPAVAAKIKQAFFTFKWEGSDLQKEFKKEGRFIGIHHKSDWAVIRQIDAANGVNYSCK